MWMFAVSDGQQMEWPVPVETLPGRNRQDLKVIIEGGDVVMVPPKSPYVLPPSSDDQLVEAIRDAREVQRMMDRGPQ